MEPDETPPPLKGVVIITLPPPDNPSLGKTITAFTLSDSDNAPPLPLPSALHTPSTHNRNPPRNRLPLRLPLSHDLRYSRWRTLLGFLSLSLFAFLLYSSTALSQLKEEEKEDKTKSFIFPLLPKSATQMAGNVEFKLGRFVGFDSPGRIQEPIDESLRHLRGFKLNNNEMVASKDNAIDSSMVLPVRGNVYPDGLYYTYILVGSPPRRYHVDMDTGSDLTWIQCDAPCTSCGKGANPLYKPKSGKIVPPRDLLCKEVQSTHKTEYCPTCRQCDYEIEYADHSSSMGILARDDLHIRAANGSLAKLNVVFGCAYDQQGLLLKSLARTDGILGLSRSPISLPSQLASTGVINNVIGHCLTSDAIGGGYMFLGDDFVPNRGMSWIPMLNSRSVNFYQSNIMRIKYGANPLGLARQDGDVVFDSGSSYTYFTKEAYSSLVASLKEVSSSGLVQDPSDHTLPLCWRSQLPTRSVRDVRRFFKTLTLQFGSKWWILSTKFDIPPEGYLIISEKGNVCLGILDGSEVLNGSTTVIGDISLRGKLVVYDNVKDRIGWENSNCVRPQRYKTPLFST